MKLTITLLLVTVSFWGSAQKVIRYFSDSWEPAEATKSTYTGEFTQNGEKYDCVFYWTGSTAVAGKAKYRDTTLLKPVGLATGYYKNGKTEDSIFYDDNGTLLYAFHFHKNGKLEVHYSASNNGTPSIEAYDENGSKIKNYIYSKEAEFKGGEKAWKAYLSKNVNSEIKAAGKEEQTVSVKVMFIINESGYPTKAKITESSGNRLVDNDAVRAILSAPAWSPAIFRNKPVKVYRIQPLTYILSPKK
jgi:periplasmic protein TonB